MKKAVRGLGAARRATVYICDRKGSHRGQGLLLDLEGDGAVVLTCHHVIAPVEADDLRVRIPQPDGGLSEMVSVRYNRDRSHPDKDAVVLRVDGIQLTERPLLHKLSYDKYNGSLEATVLTHLVPNNYNGVVRASTPLPPIAVDSAGRWPDPPDRYDLRAFRLDTVGSAKRGISGGVVLCEEGVLGLVHFARKETPESARENYVIPLTVWAEGWSALAKIIDPLVDKNLFAVAKVKRADQLEIFADIRISEEGYRPDVYLEREVERKARNAMVQCGGVVIVGKPKSGKTRLAWHLVQERQQSLVVIPRGANPPTTFEGSGLADENLVVLFDDLHESAEFSYPLLWRERLENATGRRCRLICTTRGGKDLKVVKEKQPRLFNVLGSDACVFTSRVGDKGDDVSESEGKQLAEELGMSTEEFEHRFDGTPGSLTLDLEAMRERYEHLRDELREGISTSRLLDSAKVLYEAHQSSLREPILRAVAEEIRGDGHISNDMWEALRRSTEEEGFGQFNDAGDFQIYRPYLEECVTYKPLEEEIDQVVPILISNREADGLASLAVSYLGTPNLDPERGALAINSLMQLPALKPDWPDGWYLRGVFLLSQGMYEEALNCYEEALRLSPNDTTYLQSKGEALQGMERYDKALEVFEQVLRQSPDDPEASTKAWVGKGEVLQGMERYDKALEAFEQALRLSPNDTSILLNKARILLGMKRYEESLEDAERTLRLDPESVDAWTLKAVVLQQFKQNEEALESINRALSLVGIRSGSYPEWFLMHTKELILFGIEHPELSGR